MSIFDSIRDAFEDGYHSVEGGVNDAVNATTSAGRTAVGVVGNGAVTIYQDASGGVSYGIDWTKTTAGKVDTWTRDVAGEAGDFTIARYQDARAWATDAWQYLLNALLTSPPMLGPPNPIARECMRYLVGGVFGDDGVRMWEDDARSKGYTLAIDLRCTVQVSAGFSSGMQGVSGTAFSGIYVDSDGHWGFLAGAGVGNGFVAMPSGTEAIEVWMVFGDRNKFQSKCYCLGVDVKFNISPGVAIVGGGNVLLTPGWDFEGFRIMVGAQMALPMGNYPAGAGPSFGTPRTNLVATQLAGSGPNYDAAVRVQKNPSAEAEIVATAAAAALMPDEQLDWRWCRKCSVLAYRGNGLRPCAAGGTHDFGGSGRYVFFARAASADAIGDRQDGWRWCCKCAAAYYAGISSGRCPASGGAHDLAGSGHYVVLHGTTNQPWASQANWRWCKKCQALFYGGFAGACAGGGTHDGSGSGDYVLKLEQAPNSAEQDHFRYCKRCQGLFYGDAPSVCPLGGAHDGSGSGDYVLFNNQIPSGTNGPTQALWRLCQRCGGMCYGDLGAGTCPSGGGHDFRASYNYVMIASESSQPYAIQNGWRWCKKCQGMHYAGINAGTCPAGGGHDGSGSGKYVLKHR